MGLAAKLQRGTLYVVATPIGNLADLSARAIAVLTGVDTILAEDTRHTRKLTQHHGIETTLEPLHDHNEAARTPTLVQQLREGAAFALVSDAGTPLLSDPGFVLVRAARNAGIPVVAVPGPCAAVAALSIAGLPTDRFCFEGFLPAREVARRERIDALASEPRTLVFYEAPHRLRATLADLAEGFGAERPAVVARELTKLHEALIGDTLDDLVRWSETDPHAAAGEIVVVVGGAAVEGTATATVALEPEHLLRTLLAELPVKQAVALTVKLTGGSRNALYALALRLKAGGDEAG